MTLQQSSTKQTCQLRAFEKFNKTLQWFKTSISILAKLLKTHKFKYN